MPQAAPSLGSLADQAAEAILGANPFVGIDARQLAADALQWAARLAVQPRRIGAEAAKTGLELGRVLAGRSDLGPPAGDRRFADPAWTDNPVYRRLMQGYFALAAT